MRKTKKTTATLPTAVKDSLDEFWMESFNVSDWLDDLRNQSDLEKVETEIGSFISQMEDLQAYAEAVLEAIDNQVNDNLTQAFNLDKVV